MVRWTTATTAKDTTVCRRKNCKTEIQYFKGIHENSLDLIQITEESN